MKTRFSNLNFIKWFPHLHWANNKLPKKIRLHIKIAKRLFTYENLGQCHGDLGGQQAFSRLFFLRFLGKIAKKSSNQTAGIFTLKLWPIKSEIKDYQALKGFYLREPRLMCRRCTRSTRWSAGLRCRFDTWCRSKRIGDIRYRHGEWWRSWPYLNWWDYIIHCESSELLF